MGLSNDLISQFVKVTKNKTETKKESTGYGTVVIYNDLTYVKIDGSDLLTPVSTTTELKDGERVIVTIKNHEATVSGNVSSPAASGSTVEAIRNDVTQVGILVADKASIEELNAEIARIDNLTVDNIKVNDRLTANEGYISDLQADNLKINETITANHAAIEKLGVQKIDASVVEANYATIENLNATNASIHNLEATYGEFEDLTTDRFETTDATIKNLDTKYANVDFSNINKATMEYFYANSGLIKDVVVGDATISGELIGVTIKGDLIEGNTIVADKLVIQGNDGLYYKLNTDGMNLEGEQTEYNSLNGQIITAKSITATKISVDDLVAFDATIGGFNITDHSIYSGVKESVNNSTRGVYLDNDGQMAIGDASNFIKYYKTSDGSYKLEISAKSVTIGTSGSNIEETINDVKKDVESLRDEITTLLRIESSRGTVFKNDTVATVLSVVIYHGTERITDSVGLKSTFGNSAYLQWKWQRIDEDSYGIISSSDGRFGDNGFTFTLSPEDVDTKITFMCELIV